VTTAATVCIRVCHGDPLVMAGLVSLIGREPGFQVQAGPGADEGIVDVIVADHACALSLLASAAAFGPSGAACGFHVPRIVVVTRLDKEGEVMQAIDSGARAYLRQDAPPAELMDAIRHVARGGALHLCQRTAALFRQEPRRAGLTAREEDVLRFLVRGDCNKGIARQLDISTSTVKAHVSRICEKLHASSRVQVAVNATRRGLLRR
jgi:two-component system nitrate/nitrite response regulator NarL